MKLHIFSLWAGAGGGAPRRVRSRLRRGAAWQKKHPREISEGALVMKKVALRLFLADFVFEVHAHCHCLNQSAFSDHLV